MFHKLLKEKNNTEIILIKLARHRAFLVNVFLIKFLTDIGEKNAGGVKLLRDFAYEVKGVL